LARRDVAIVSASPGTTRDIIEVHLDLGGVPVTIADTAGLRESVDAVEQEGVRRARRRAAAADVVLAVFDAVDFDEAAIAEVSDIPAEALVILNKMDLVEQPAAGRVSGRRALAVSCLTGLGLDQLVTVVAERAADCVGEGLGPTRARHRAALTTCVEALTRLDDVEDAELVAEDLRVATRALGRLTGRVDVEDILDVIFAEFCIGK
jgi:tRNA modification GTPase